MERRAGLMASLAAPPPPVALQELASRSEPGRVVAPERVSAPAGPVHSATVHAVAWLALALPASV
jgi:hypothetical protein